MSSLFLHRVTKRFGNVPAVSRLTVEFRERKIAALIGPNGAGKTTVFNLIGGQLSPSEGHIYYDGEEISGRSPWRIAEIGVGRMFQDVRTFPRMSVKNNVLVGFREQKGEHVFWSVIARSAVRQQEKELNSKADELLEIVGLQGYGERRARELSYGQQKLLAIARLLATGSDVLLLDEPTAGVARSIAEKILRVLREAADDGKTIVIIEHDMNIVSEWVDEVHFIDAGRLSVSGQPEEILRTSQVRRAYLGV
jgi:ABC-type branched-subunit amino acid transport system ATPase component